MISPNVNRLARCITAWLFGAATIVASEDTGATWKCGVAQTKITPGKLLWMGGFAARKHPAEGTLDDLYVNTLVAAIEAVLAQPLRPLSPVFRAAFEFVALDFGAQPTRAELDTIGRGTDYRALWARRLSAELAADKTFASGYPACPVQVWRLGEDQLWIAIGGEVCVDYALRFKRAFGSGTWVNGYANDVMAYIPSRRLWEEGGYQAGAFEVYGLPAPRWCSEIEDRIAGAVGRLVKRFQGAEISPARAAADRDSNHPTLSGSGGKRQ
jgi:hypothetical protein